jgi:hypothetical protein
MSSKKQVCNIIINHDATVTKDKSYSPLTSMEGPWTSSQVSGPATPVCSKVTESLRQD